MCKALDVITPIYDRFKAVFNREKMESADSSNKLSSSKIRDVAAALDVPNYLICAEFYRVLGTIVDRYAGKMEICDCHAHLWQRGRSFRKRKRMLESEVGSECCVWQGRRLAWWISTGYSEFVSILQSCTSQKLQDLLACTEASVRTEVCIP